MERLVEMVAFVNVVEARSFSSAARKMGTSKSVISKRINSLEQGLGVRLLSRSTRSMSLTESGAAYYDQCVRIVQAIEAAENSVARLQAQPRGVLKISTPTIFGRLFMAPLIQSYCERFPEVEIELDASDRIVDLVNDGFDLALRVTAEPAPNMVARKLASVGGVICAAPSYLQERGTPTVPEELLSHVCLVYHGPDMHSAWRFNIDGKPGVLDVSGRFRVNTLEVMLTMALRGMGILLAPDYVVAAHLKSGKLKSILSRHIAYPDKALWLTYLPNRYLQPKVRSFIDHTIEYFGANPDWAEF
jgi:DNA-binding transcriptional LysR family regulator